MTNRAFNIDGTPFKLPEGWNVIAPITFAATSRELTRLRNMREQLRIGHENGLRIWNVQTRKVGGLRFLKVGRLTVSWSVASGPFKPLKGC